MLAGELDEVDFAMHIVQDWSDEGSKLSPDANRVPVVSDLVFIVLERGKQRDQRQRLSGCRGIVRRGRAWRDSGILEGLSHQRHEYAVSDDSKQNHGHCLPLHIHSAEKRKYCLIQCRLLLYTTKLNMIPMSSYCYKSGLKCPHKVLFKCNLCRGLTFMFCL